MGTVNHPRIFMYALRTAILATVGFLLFEILQTLSKKYKKDTIFSIHLRYLIKFTFIFIIDFIILYIFAKFFGIIS